MSYLEVGLEVSSRVSLEGSVWRLILRVGFGGFGGFGGGFGGGK